MDSQTYKAGHRSERPDLTVVYGMNARLFRTFGDIKETDLDDFWGDLAPNGQKRILDLEFARTEPHEST